MDVAPDAKHASLVRVLLGILAGAAAGLSVLGTMRYGGSKPLFAVFCACYLALAALAVPRPRPYGLLFLALFLLLGFWLKTIAHFVWQAEFVEPVGAFGFKPSQWDAALLLATAGAGGAVAVRVLHLWLARRRPDALGADVQPGAPAPAWFIAWRRPVWIVTLALIVAFNALNFFFSIYQVGVNPKVVLPLRLNVPIAWLVNIGFALWLAALVWWDSRSGKGFTGGFLAAMFEALVASMSAHSRFFFLLHAGPYWLVGAERWRSLRINLRRRAIVALAAAFVLLLVISLAAISRMRFQEYFDMPKLPPDYTEARYYREVVQRQLGRLVVQRWVGLEGSLIAVSAPGQGREAFRRRGRRQPAPRRRFAVPETGEGALCDDRSPVHISHQRGTGRAACPFRLRVRGLSRHGAAGLDRHRHGARRLAFHRQSFLLRSRRRRPRQCREPDDVSIPGGGLPPSAPGGDHLRRGAPARPMRLPVPPVGTQAWSRAVLQLGIALMAFVSLQPYHAMGPPEAGVRRRHAHRDRRRRVGCWPALSFTRQRLRSRSVFRCSWSTSASCLRWTAESRAGSSCISFTSRCWSSGEARICGPSSEIPLVFVFCFCPGSRVDLAAAGLPLELPTWTVPREIAQRGRHPVLSTRPGAGSCRPIAAAARRGHAVPAVRHV